MVAGQVDATSEASVATLPLIHGGKLKGLAITGDKRMTSAPTIPTTAEEGLPTLRIVHWAGLLAPTGTPEGILDKMNAAVNAALKAPEVQLALQRSSQDAGGGTRARSRRSPRTNGPAWGRSSRPAICRRIDFHPAPQDARGDMHAMAVAQLGQGRHLPEDQVRPLARDQRCLPSSCRPRARAAAWVTPFSASAGVSRNSVQAMFNISSRDVNGDVPGLQSVATAMGTPYRRSSSTGGTRVSRRK